MTADDERVQLIFPAEPRVALQRMGDITTFEVMDNELDYLDQMVSDENRALGFLTGFGGVFVSLVGAILTAGTLTPYRLAAFVGLIAVSGSGSLWFGLVYNRARKVRPAFIERIRARARKPVTPPAPAP